MTSIRHNAGDAITDVTPATKAAATYPCAAVQDDPILRAAYDVLMDVGPRQATLTEVARRAGVSRMTLYRRYDHLRTLVNEVLTAELRTVLAAAANTPSAGSDRERIAVMAAAATRGIADHPLMLRIVDLDPEALLPLIVTRRGSTQRAAEDTFAALVAAADDGSVQVANPQLAARTIVTACSAFVYAEAQALSAGEDDSRWQEVTRLVKGYLA